MTVLNTCTRCPLQTWEWNILPEPISVKFRKTEQVGPRGTDSKYSTISISHSQQDWFLPKLHQVRKYDLAHPYFTNHTSRQSILWSHVASTHTPTRIWIPPIRHKFRCQNLADSFLGWTCEKYGQAYKFDYETAGNTVNTVMARWCSGTLSWPVCQVESGKLGHICKLRWVMAGPNLATHNHVVKEKGAQAKQSYDMWTCLNAR